jgi:hypothetical protein
MVLPWDEETRGGETGLPDVTGGITRKTFCGEGGIHEFGGYAFPPEIMRLGKRWMMMERKEERGEVSVVMRWIGAPVSGVAAHDTDLLLYVSAHLSARYEPHITVAAPSGFWEPGSLLCFDVSPGHHSVWGLVFLPSFSPVLGNLWL